MSASAVAEQPMIGLRYVDVLLIVVAAPIMLLIGVSAAGYGIGAGTWIVLRAVGVAVERAAEATAMSRAVGIRLGYMLGRLFALAIAVILARKSDGQDAGLAALVVIVFAFTVQLAISAAIRPGSGAAASRRGADGAASRPRSR
ncbi:MAG: hypothetical protein M3Z06_07410 [Actinomycetota bacterium]|nr:hypothetical protein [Actinomycetota bacterium]